MTSNTPESTTGNVIKFGGARERLELRRLIRVGNQALIGAMDHGEIDLIGAVPLGETVSSADAEFLGSVRDVALKIRETGGLRGSSIAAFLLLPHKVFEGYRPVDIIAAGQPGAAVDAGVCFVDPGREFDESLRPNIERAIEMLDEAWS